MRARSGLFVAVAAVLVVASLGVSPFQLSYVTSGSMEPTLSEGDGYVLVGGDVEVGDVITFRTEDGYVTHRVVGESAGGYTTRGDANPSTDQAGGAPLIQEEQVLGKALTVGGQLVVVPGLGTVAGVAEGYRPYVLGALVTLLLASAVRDARRERETVPDRDMTHVGEVVLPLLAGLSVACVAVLAVSVTTQQLTYVATAVESGGSTLNVGEPAVRTVTVEVARTPLTQVVVDAQGVTVLDRTVQGSTAELTLRVPAQSEPGPYSAAASVHPYPAVVPRSLVVWLHGVNPWLACVGSTAVVFAPFWLAYGLLFDGGMPLRDEPIARGGR
jgi:signal peptidase